MIPSVQALFVQPGHELVGYLHVVLVREGNVRVAEKAHFRQRDQGSVTSVAVDCLHKLSRSELCAAPDFGVVVVGNLLGNVVAKDDEDGHAGELFEFVQRDGWRILCTHVQLSPGNVRRDLALGEDKVRGLIGYYGLHKVGLGESSSPAALAASRMRHEDARACHDKEFLQRLQQIVSRESILEHMADRTDSYDRSIDVQVSRLLAKLRDSGRNPTLIRTMRGDGYMLAVPVTREEGQGDR